MNTPKPTAPDHQERTLADAMEKLAETVREAGESMLDLQQAVETLKMANEPHFARRVARETGACLRDAMRR